MHQRPALVVFEHRPGRGILRLLSPGYRHCFCLLRVPEGWLLVDPLKTCTSFDTIPSLTIAVLVQSYVATGRRVIAGFTRRESGPCAWSPRPMTCVESVKRLVGVAAPGVWTPRQLFLRLTNPSRTFPPFIEPAKATKSP
jgi:hypothetical protein